MATAHIILRAESSDHPLRCWKVLVVNIPRVKPKFASLISSPASPWWSPEATHRKHRNSFPHGNSGSIWRCSWRCPHCVCKSLWLLRPFLIPPASHYRSGCCLSSSLLQCLTWGLCFIGTCDYLPEQAVRFAGGWEPALCICVLMSFHIAWYIVDTKNWWEERRKEARRKRKMEGKKKRKGKASREKEGRKEEREARREGGKYEGGRKGERKEGKESVNEFLVLFPDSPPLLWACLCQWHF